MRYSSALVLGTLAAGSAAAAHNGRHASFHARRNAETKRGVQDTDWSKVSYDLSGVNWSTVKYGNQQAAPTPSAEVKSAQVQAVSSVAVQQPQTSATPAPTSAQAASSSKAAAPSSSSSSGSGSGSGVLGDFTKGVESFFAGLNQKVNIDPSYTNQKSGNIYIGDGSAWKANFVNGGSEDLYFTCWEKTKGGAFGGMSLNVQPPAIAAYLAPGDSLTVSFGENVPAACAPLLSGTTMAEFGGVSNTWWEATFNSYGAFDVSRNVDMHGTNIHSKGSKCTSDMNTCVFKCKNKDAPNCKEGSDYDLFGCGGSTGGGGGYDSAMAGTGGGCAMGSSSESVTVTFNNPADAPVDY